MGATPRSKATGNNEGILYGRVDSMSAAPTNPEQVRIIPASQSELEGEPAILIEAYHRYWAVKSWDPVKKRIFWAETLKVIVDGLGATPGKMQSVREKHAVLIETVICPGCGGKIGFSGRQEAQQALRGTVPLCNDCEADRAEASKLRHAQKTKDFGKLERQILKAFNAVICDDHRPEDCVSSLNESQVTLYLDMLKRQREDSRVLDYIGMDSRGNHMYAEPRVILHGWYAYDLGDKYKKSGPDLYELARHRLIEPLGSLASSIALTRHGLINPSGYPTVIWSVQQELDGWPLVGLVGKQLRLLSEDK